MIYFSELKGKKVLTEDNIEVGKLDDLIFLASENPKVTKLLVLDKLNNKLFIPICDVKKLNNLIIVSKSYFSSTLEENELYVLRNLLDKQIIDIVGNKVVRVNDVAIQEKILLSNLYELNVLGVDVGLFGILRWLKVDEIISKLIRFLGINISSRYLSWGDIAPLELTQGKVILKKKEEKLQNVRPEDLADYLERTNVINARKFLRILDNKKAAEVISYLNINYQLDLFKQYKPEKIAEILEYIDPDEAVDVLLTLSEKKRQQIMDLLPDKKRKEFNYLINLSTTPIGNLLTTEYITVLPNNIVKEVIEKIKKETADFSFLTPVYVINQEDQLVGVFSLHELLLADLNTPIYKFMVQNVIVIHLTTPAAIALNKMIKYKLAALPVIDSHKKILGIVSITDIYNSAIRK